MRRRYPFLWLLACALLASCMGELPTPPASSSAANQAAAASMEWFDATVLKSDKVVLADFSATWCGPCQYLRPLLHRLEKKYGDRLKVVAIDIDEHPVLQARFGVQGIPHLLLFSDGEVIVNPGPGLARFKNYEALEEFVRPWLPVEEVKEPT